MIEYRSGPHEGSDRVHLVVCPACGARKGEDFKQAPAHIADHYPEDFGLSPLRTDPANNGGASA